MLPWDEVFLLCVLLVVLYLVVRASRRRIRRASKRQVLRWDIGGQRSRSRASSLGGTSGVEDLDDLDGGAEANTGLIRTWYSMTIWTTAFNMHCLDYLYPENVPADSLPLTKTVNEVSVDPPDQTPLARKGLVRRAYVSAIYASSVPVCIAAMLLAVGVVAYSAGASWLDIVTIVQRERALRKARLGMDIIAPGVLGASGDAAVNDAVAGLAKRSLDVAAGLAKRALPAVGDVQGSEQAFPAMPARYISSSALTPLIPGLTVPISHLLPLLLTLLVTQVTHEFGHLLLAALDGIEPVQIVLRIIAGFAGMGVVFGEELEQKSGKIKARIAAAGPFNNILSYLLLLSLGIMQIANVLYHEFTPHGRIVLGFGPNSAVLGHIPTNAVIQYVDDLFVGGDRDVWKRYLVGGMGGYLDDSRGWCVDKKRFDRSVQPPCPRNAPVSFTPLPHSPNSTRCLPAYPLLTTRTWACPCNLASQICVRPLASEMITRVQWVYEGAEKLQKEERESQVLLWKGDRRELYEGLRVSRWAGRGGRTGRWLLEMIEVFFGYLSAISLTLGLLNLLPLPPLDGGHLVSALLDMRYPGTNETLHSGEEDAPTPADSPEAATPEEKVTEHTTPLDLPLSSAVARSAARATADPALVKHRRRIERGVGWTTGTLVVLALGGMGLTMAFDRLGVGR